MCLLPIHALKSMARIAPQHDVRHYLNGVLAEFHQDCTILVVTNGCYLVAHRYETKQDAERPSELIIPREWAMQLKPSESRHASPLIPVMLDQEGLIPAEFLGSKEPTPVKPLDATYPRWREIIPQSVSGEAALLNPHYQSAVLTCVAGCERLDEVPSRPLTPNGNKPAMAVYGNTLAVLMPLSDMEQKLYRAPEWALKQATKVRQAA